MWFSSRAGTRVQCTEGTQTWKFITVCICLKHTHTHTRGVKSMKVDKTTNSRILTFLGHGPLSDLDEFCRREGRSRGKERQGTSTDMLRKKIRKPISPLLSIQRTQVTKSWAWG